MNFRLRAIAGNSPSNPLFPGLRAFILNDLAAAMRRRYFTTVEPAVEGGTGAKPADGAAVHDAMQGDLLFQIYSSMRYNAQEMVWRSVLRPLAEAAPAIDDRLATLRRKQAEVGGSLTLDPALPLPKNVSALDVHLAPGSYHREEDGMDWLGRRGLRPRPERVLLWRDGRQSG